MIDNKALRPMLSYNYENNYRKLTSSLDFVRDFLKDILIDSPTTYFIVDGLDEIAGTERLMLLAFLMNLQRQSPKLKLLISSRTEYDIRLHLEPHCNVLCVHQQNSQDIAEYIDSRTEVWLSELDIDPELTSELKSYTKEIAPKSKGVLFGFQC